MIYLVTGGAGFIGSHIAECLLDDGHEVIILDNFFSGRMDNIKPFLSNSKFKLVKASITDCSVLKNICESVDGIFHEAAITSVTRSIKEPVMTNENNISGTLKILVAARDEGVKKVIFASSSSVYGDTLTLPKEETMCPNPKSPYAVTKHTCEEYMKIFSELYGLQTISLRYFNVFGPRQNPQSDYAAVIPKFVTSILSHRNPVIYGDGTQTRDFTYVKDVAEANLRAMYSNAEGIYNIACENQIDLNSLANLIMDLVGIRVNPKYEVPRPGDIHKSLANCKKARDAFGYSPRFKLKTGLLETIQWYQERTRI